MEVDSITESCCPFAETLSVRIADQMGVEVVLESMLENFFFSLSLKERPNKLERL